MAFGMIQSWRDSRSYQLGKSYGRLGTSWGYSLSWEFKVPPPPPKGLIKGLFLGGGGGIGGLPEIPMTLTILMFFFLEHFGWYWPDGQWITRHDPIAVLSPFPQLAPWKIIPQRGPTKLLLSHLRVICIYISLYIYIYIHMYLNIHIIHFSVHVTSKVHHPMEKGSAKGAPLACSKVNLLLIVWKQIPSLIPWFDHHLFTSFGFNSLKASPTRTFCGKTQKPRRFGASFCFGNPDDFEGATVLDLWFECTPQKTNVESKHDHVFKMRFLFTGWFSGSSR